MDGGGGGVCGPTHGESFSVRRMGGNMEYSPIKEISLGRSKMGLEE